MIVCKFCYTDITKEEEDYVGCCAQRKLITQPSSEEPVVPDEDVELGRKKTKVEVTDVSKKDCEFCNGSSFFKFDEGEVQMHFHNEDITFSSGNGTKARREYYLPVNYCPICGNKLKEVTE